MKLINTLLCEQQARCISKSDYDYLYNEVMYNSRRFPHNNFRETLLGILKTVKRKNYRITIRQADVLRKHVNYKLGTVPCNQLSLNEIIRK